jgi:hypothetical protein
MVRPTGLEPVRRSNSTSSCRVCRFTTGALNGPPDWIRTSNPVLLRHPHLPIVLQGEIGTAAAIRTRDAAHRRRCCVRHRPYGAPSRSRTRIVGLEGRLPVHRPGHIGAGDGTRTHGVNLGKVVQLPLCDTRVVWLARKESNFHRSVISRLHCHLCYRPSIGRNDRI